MVEGAGGGGPHDFDEVCFESHHEGLALGVAESAVEFEDFGACGGEDESGVEDASELDFFASKRIDGGNEDVVFDLCHECGVDFWNGGVSAHSASVGSGVVFA